MKTVKKWMLVGIVWGLIALLAACGGAPSLESDAVAVPAPGQAAGTPEPEASATDGTLTEDYPDALSLRNQLALGTLRLEGTPDAITVEQAGKLLPLWQALKANQIMATLEPAQIASIAALQLTNADLQEYYVEIGVSEVKTPEPGVTPQSSSMKDLSPEEREAARATAEALGTPVGTGAGSGGGKSYVLLDAVIELLMKRAGQ